VVPHPSKLEYVSSHSELQTQAGSATALPCVLPSQCVPMGSLSLSPSSFFNKYFHKLANINAESYRFRTNISPGLPYVPSSVLIAQTVFPLDRGRTVSQSCRANKLLRWRSAVARVTLRQLGNELPNSTFVVAIIRRSCDVNSSRTNTHLYSPKSVAHNIYVYTARI